MSHTILSEEEVLTKFKDAMEGYVRGVGPAGMAKLQASAQKPEFAKRAAELQRETMALAQKAMTDLEGAKKDGLKIGTKALALSLEAIKDTFGEDGLKQATAAVNTSEVRQALSQHGMKDLLALLPSAPKADRRREMVMPRP